MHSDRALLRCLQLLVLVDLAFVQMTGATSLAWLGPLYALTFAAPWLRALAEKRAYRILWNGAVIAVFAVLVRHALQADLSSVLEDGLILAVLCQVHLLNNLRTSQRPDILFLNAFLIAIVTGFLCRGLGFPVALTVFAPVYMIGLQLMNATRGGVKLADGVTLRLVLDGARRAAVIGAGAVLVFLFWPRDFDRGPYFKDTFRLHTSVTPKLELGFSEQIDLDRSQGVSQRNRPTLQARLLAGQAHGVPTLWRGATLAYNDGDTWRSWGKRRQAGRRPTDAPWTREQRRIFRDAPRAADEVRLRVTRFEQGTERLFAPLGARELALTTVHAQRGLYPRRDANVDVAGMAEVEYDLTCSADPPACGGPAPAVVALWMRPFVALPDDSAGVEAARALAAQLRAKLPRSAEQHQVVERLSDHLRSRYRYRPPGARGAARTLEEFLGGDRGGHCEFFASALATMLRSEGIPCRVATGFRASDWDAAGEVLSIGTRDAHAWVEVHDPQAGWVAVDPTPGRSEVLAGEGLWTRLWARARAGWYSVTDFDAERRAAFYAWARSVPRRLAQSPSALAVAAGLTLLLALVVVRRRSCTPPDVRAYRRALRAVKLSPLPGETPRELVARARELGLPEARLVLLESATREHEVTRYAA